MAYVFLAAFVLVTAYLAGGVLKNPKKKKPIARSRYRATSIVSGAACCQAVKSFEGTYFLDIEKATPSLPLTDCNSADCKCRYVHRNDRREDQEGRRQLGSLHSELYDRNGKPERRCHKRDRRKTDEALAM